MLNALSKSFTCSLINSNADKATQEFPVVTLFVRLWLVECLAGTEYKLGYWASELGSKIRSLVYENPGELGAVVHVCKRRGRLLEYLEQFFLCLLPCGLCHRLLRLFLSCHDELRGVS